MRSARIANSRQAPIRMLRTCAVRESSEAWSTSRRLFHSRRTDFALSDRLALYNWVRPEKKLAEAEVFLVARPMTYLAKSTSKDTQLPAAFCRALMQSTTALQDEFCSSLAVMTVPCRS